jgi:hypothetical protein
MTERMAKEFAAKFITEEEAAGRKPTQAGLERAARQANKRGGREFLRAAFHQLSDVKRGRPSNASAKFAKK